VPIEVILIDADGVIQYSPEEWGEAFARCLGREYAHLAQNFTADIFAAEAACLSQVGGFDQALDDVLNAWDCMAKKSFVLDAMMSIHKHNEVLEVFSAVRADGAKCYIASNQQTQRAEFMSAELGYASTFDGELYSCRLGAAKPSELYFELALKAAGADANSTLFIDDRPANVAGARRAGLQSFVYDGRSGAAVLKSHLRDFGLTAT